MTAQMPEDGPDTREQAVIRTVKRERTSRHALCNNFLNSMIFGWIERFPCSACYVLSRYVCVMRTAAQMQPSHEPIHHTEDVDSFWDWLFQTRSSQMPPIP